MARPRGRNDVVCQNPRCLYYLREKGTDVIKNGKYKSTRTPEVLLQALQDIFYGDEGHTDVTH